MLLFNGEQVYYIINTTRNEYWCEDCVGYTSEITLAGIYKLPSIKRQAIELVAPERVSIAKVDNVAVEADEWISYLSKKSGALA